MLAWRLPSLPEHIPAYRTPAGDHLVAKSALVVLRVPLIGAACLAAVHTMLLASPAGGWRGVWNAAAACLAVKTLAEALELALLGTDSPAISAAAKGATLVAVVAFAVVVATSWARGRLPMSGEGAPGLRDLGVRERGVLLVAFVVWLALASAPVWSG